MTTQRSPEPPDVELELGAVPENVAIVRQALRAVAAGLQLEAERIDDVALAGTEACANVVMHAYRDGPPGPMQLRVFVAADALTVVVADRGGGIEPRADSPGLGVGIPLMSALTDALALGSGPDGATEVRLVFARDGAAAQPPAAM
jgi:serine/threonine-protein kinase RsbW